MGETLTAAVGDKTRWYAKGSSGFGGDWKNDMTKERVQRGQNFQDDGRGILCESNERDRLGAYSIRLFIANSKPEQYDAKNVYKFPTSTSHSVHLLRSQWE
jgi:hypothetical protein